MPVHIPTNEWKSWISSYCTLRALSCGNIVFVQLSALCSPDKKGRLFGNVIASDALKKLTFYGTYPFVSVIIYLNWCFPLHLCTNNELVSLNSLQVVSLYISMPCYKVSP